MPSERMHWHDRLLTDLDYFRQCRGCGSWPHLSAWVYSDDDIIYSTSQHLEVMIGICRGLKVRRIGEVGVGRSSFLLAALAQQLQAQFITCDRFDYRYMFERAGIDDKLTYILGDAERFFSHPDVNRGLDFLFLDYLSSRKHSPRDCYAAMKRGVRLLPTNGILAVHDALEERYNVGRGLKMLRSKMGGDIESIVLPYNYGLALIRRVGPSPYGRINDHFHKTPEGKGEPCSST